MRRNAASPDKQQTDAAAAVEALRFATAAVEHAVEAAVALIEQSTAKLVSPAKRKRPVSRKAATVHEMPPRD